MNPFELIPLRLILDRLEEELNFLRGILPMVDTLSEGEILELFGRTVENFNTCGEILEMVSSEESSRPPEGEFYEPLLEFMLIGGELLERFERKLPLFLGEITVFNEPLMDKIEQLQRTFSSVEETERRDYEELSYVVREIAQTLDSLYSRTKTLMEKIS